MMTVLLTMALSWPSGAQQWTLQDCVDYALEHNISLKQSEIVVSQREVDLNTAENNRLPSLSGSTSQNFSFGRGLTADNTYANTNTTSTGFSLGSSVPVFNGFQIKNGIAMSKLNLAAATVDLEKARESIIVAVAQAYVQILYNNEILDVARMQVEKDSLQVIRLQEMERSGKTSAAEVAAQVSTLAQSRLEATTAENNLMLSKLELTQLLELESPEGFDVVRPDATSLEIGILPSPDMVFADAVEIKPAIEAEKIRLDYAATNIDYAKSGLYPSLSLSGGIGSNYYTSSGRFSTSFGDQMKNNFSQYLGLSLNIPIFSKYSVRNGIRNAKLNYFNQELQLDAAKKALYKEIQQAYYNAVSAQEKFRSSSSAADAAAEEFSLMTAKYENGKANVTQYNESKARYVQAQSNLVQARYQHLYQTRLLDFYRGRSIVF